MQNQGRWAAILLSWVLAFWAASGMAAPGPAYGGAAEEVEKDFLRVVEEVMPAVVSIDYCLRKKNMPQVADLCIISSQGSGFIFLPKGYILTNAHVLIEDAPEKKRLKALGPENLIEKIWVTLSDGRTFNGEFIFADPHRDLAAIKISGDKFPTVKLGDSDQLMPGQWAIAMGNPYGFQSSVTVGVISALQRHLGNKPGDFIQTSAPIFPGNSGGPLIDIRGRVIGINTKVKVEDEQVLDTYRKPLPLLVPIRTQAMGFAIPIRRALDVIRPHLQ